MAENIDFGEFNEAKISFDEIYNKLTPIHYYLKLRAYDYSIPDAAKPVFEQVIGALRQQRKRRRARICDIGCSYGINAALLKYDLTLAELEERYRLFDRENLSTAAAVRADAEYFEALGGDDDLRFIGIDAAPNAVQYAEHVGLLDAGLALDLERTSATGRDALILDGLDLVISTGAIGYVTEQTFLELLDVQDETAPAPWLACFTLRMFPPDAIVEALAKRGYVTEIYSKKLYFQRRFVDAEERRGVEDNLKELGLDPAGLESDGGYYARFFLTRPKADAKKQPLDEILRPLARGSDKAMKDLHIPAR